MTRFIPEKVEEPKKWLFWLKNQKSSGLDKKCGFFTNGQFLNVGPFFWLRLYYKVLSLYEGFISYSYKFFCSDRTWLFEANIANAISSKNDLFDEDKIQVQSNLIGNFMRGKKNVYYCQMFTIYHVINAIIANFGKQEKVY